MTDSVDIKVVSMKEWCRDEGLVRMLEVMLESAKNGTLIGAAGVFLMVCEEEGDEPRLGTLLTDNMSGNVFTVVGALEKIKMTLLEEIETE